MTWGTLEGERGRCDARRHEAEHPTCICMCGGPFHGSARDGTSSAGIDRGSAVRGDIYHSVVIVAMAGTLVLLNLGSLNRGP